MALQTVLSPSFRSVGANASHLEVRPKVFQPHPFVVMGFIHLNEALEVPAGKETKTMEGRLTSEHAQKPCRRELDRSEDPFWDRGRPRFLDQPLKHEQPHPPPTALAIDRTSPHVQKKPRGERRVNAPSCLNAGNMPAKGGSRRHAARRTRRRISWREREQLGGTSMGIKHLLASCGVALLAQTALLATPAAASADKPVIALANAYYGNTWRHQMVDSFEAAAKQANDAA
jgi:hypothetical protein